MTEYSLLVLEATGAKSRCHRAAVPLEAFGEAPSSLFQLPEAPGISGLVAPSVQCVPPSSQGLFLVSLILVPLLRMLVSELGHTQMTQDDLILTQ